MCGGCVSLPVLDISFHETKRQVSVQDKAIKTRFTALTVIVWPECVIFSFFVDNFFPVRVCVGIWWQLPTTSTTLLNFPEVNRFFIFLYALHARDFT